jgi:hypothetical protein
VLGAARHLYLHSRESLRELAAAHGLRLLRIEDDSTGFQFWGSEQIRRGIPLATEDGRIVPRAELARAVPRYERRARALNRQERGDQIAAVFVPAPAAAARGSERA